VSALESLSHDLPGGGHVLFTAREHGNMSSVGGDGAESGERSRELLRERLGVRWLARGYQVHGAVVQRVQVPEIAAGRVGEADGQATVLPGVGAMVLTADCLPVALGSPGAVAMLHAGWRGLAAGVLEQGVRELELLGAERKEIVAVIGPGAGACCYEVGPEVHGALGARSRTRGERDDGHRHNRHIDLQAIARDRLLGAGVTQVLDVQACTICDERFFSHRREGRRAGRQAGVAWLG
jgi:polyphenol oxidase